MLVGCFVACFSSFSFSSSSSPSSFSCWLLACALALALARLKKKAVAEAAGLLSAELAGSECGRGYSLGGDICFRHLLIKFSSLLRNDCFICPGASSQSQLKLDSSRRAVGRMFFCGSRCRSPVQEEVIRMKRFLVAVVAKLLKVYFSYLQFLFIFHLPPQSCDCRETRRMRRSSWVDSMKI